MKEYVAQTGGRYTYADDILNLQSLALSMTTIFDGCSDFIISGCEIDGPVISSGYVWLGGKVRYFEGANSVTFPYYIYEANSTESVVYANEANKTGRHNFLCLSGSLVPESVDSLTGKKAAFIEIKENYAPRFLDKFIGKYALLLNTPFTKQTVKKDIAIEGRLFTEKDIESKTAISIVNSSNGYVLKNIVKANGVGSVGMYLNGLLVNEIAINTDGSFSFLKQNIELARIDENGILSSTTRSTSAYIGLLSIYDNKILNIDSNRDDGAVEINILGYNNTASHFRNFIVYDGKQRQILKVDGKSANVGVFGSLTVNGADAVAIIKNTSFLKTDIKLKSATKWQDRNGEDIASIGYINIATFDFTIKNHIGNIVIAPTGDVDIQGGLKINGIYISTTYVNVTDFTRELAKKVYRVDGKALSDENFTLELKTKLEDIATGTIKESDNGYVRANDVVKALALKLTSKENLKDVSDIGVARDNLNLYSRLESDNRYLQITDKLTELVKLTDDEVNDLTLDEALALRAERQTEVRLNIDAEKAGLVDLKLAKLSNFADLSDIPQARKNISVYSISEIDAFLKKKLDADNKYDGEVFTTALKTKLEGINKGNFAYVDSGTSISHSQVEGYVSTSQVVIELRKKANLLMDGYNLTQKNTIAANLGIYTKSAADIKFATVESLFQDYFTYLAKQGKSTTAARQILREKFDVFSKGEITGTYIRKDSKLGDLHMPNADAKKLACRNIGAAYADEYQTKLVDTGWVNMGGSNNGRLFIRQIGNIVSIQGIINTASHDNGVIAVIPNSIQPPAYGVRCTQTNFNNEYKRNYGATFRIHGGARQIVMYNSEWSGQEININFTYMT